MHVFFKVVINTENFHIVVFSSKIHQNTCNQSIAGLLESGLETEQTLRGLSDDEILLAELQWDFKFPKAYYLFLKYFGQSSQCFIDQDWNVESLPFAKELSLEVAGRNNLELDDWFPFSERQWYSFVSFKIGGLEIENPEVMLVVEGDEGAKVSHYPSFTDWFLNNFESYLKLLVMLEKPGSKLQLAQFEKLMLAP